MKNCTKKSAYCAILLQCLGNLCASFLAHTGKEKRCKIVFQTILQRFVGDLTKYPPVLFESRCSINPSFTRMAKCLPIAATLLPDISAIPLRWMPGFKRIIVYVALTLSFSVSFIVSLASLFLLLGTGSTNSLSISSYITNYSPYDFSPHGIQISRPLLLCPIR